MLLCAGLGTRLRPLTDERPKPLVPLNDRPLASYALELLAAAGVTHVVANAFHLADQVGPALAPWAARFGQSLTVLTEAVLLGTGGGIRNALPHLGDAPFVVFNGDVLAAPDLGAALRLHRDSGATMTLVLRDDPRAEDAGAIEVDGDGRVVRLRREGPDPVGPTRRCLFTGIYVVSPAVAPDLPANGCVVRHTLRRLLARGERVSATVDPGPWHDLGTLSSYAAAQFAMLRGELDFPGWQPPAGACLLGRDVQLDPRVRPGSAVCVGSGARVTGAGSLARALVWDGAVAEAPCEQVVITRRMRVPIPA